MEGQNVNKLESSSEESTSKAKKTIIITENDIPGAKLVKISLQNDDSVPPNDPKSLFALSTRYQIPARFGTGELLSECYMCHFNDQ